jgi:mannosylglycerate hydrolase
MTAEPTIHHPATDTDPAAATLWVVPHAHWDREWYLPFQRFRVRLVGVLDEVFRLLDAEPDFAFTLDGQTAALADYLDIRPERAADVRRHVADGRLAVGPWTVLMDEFLVDGETIVRNLQRGIATSVEHGGAMSVGYLPDMFGHIAQMPQILTLAGLDRAVVWRGVPTAVDRHRFHWQAPDGSVVRAEYLLDGYGQALGLLSDADDPLEAANGYVASRAGFAPLDVLAMTGADHIAPGKTMLAAAAQVHAAADAPAVRIATVEAYLDEVTDAEGLPRWHGELRSAARANLLPGVTSNRVDVRAASRRAEDHLLRIAEPLLALHAHGWPDALLDHAWQRVIVNSAHDSVCACSVDEVVDQVLVRYAEARQIADGLVEHELFRRTAAVPAGGLLIANPLPRPRTGLVELSVPANGPAPRSLALPDGTRGALQELAEQASDELDLDSDAADVRAHLDVRHGRELMGGHIGEVDLDESGAVPCVVVWIDTEPRPARLDVDRLLEPVHARLAEFGDAPCRLLVRWRPRRRLLAHVEAGALVIAAAVPDPQEPAGPAHPVTVDGTTMDNGLVRCVVRDDGLLDLVAADGGPTLTGLGELVDGGDVGDTYNYGPPAHDRVVRVPDSVSVEVEEHGPLRARVRLVRRYRWPADGGDLRSRPEPSVPVDVTTTVELRADEPFVRLHVRFDNPCRDHRLRLHLPLARPTDHSLAEGHYAVLRRGLQGEGGHGELPLATFPAHDLVAAGDLAVLLDRVTEYELVDDGATLALTLLRATGMLSRNHNPGRRDPAGPQLPTPGAQVLGPHEVSFGLRPLGGPSDLAAALYEAHAFRVPLLTLPGTGASTGAEWIEPGLEVAGEGVVVSALRREGDELELRLSAPLGDPTTATVGPGVAAARVVDLLGDEVQPLVVDDGTVTVALRPCEIRTLRLRRTGQG